MCLVFLPPPAGLDELPPEVVTEGRETHTHTTHPTPAPPPPVSHAAAGRHREGGHRVAGGLPQAHGDRPGTCVLSDQSAHLEDKAEHTFCLCDTEQGACFV